MHSEKGIAVVAATMAMLLLAAVGAALLLASAAETKIVSNARTGAEAFYAAEGALDRALSDLREQPDWTAVLNATVRSSFTDGSPGGIRTLVDGTHVDLTAIVNDANCQHSSACTPSDMDAITAERPWGPNNPRWTLYAYGPLASVPGIDSQPSPYYLVTLVADDGSETDGDPLRDDDGPGHPGHGVVVVRGEAFGPGGVVRAVEATVGQVPTDESGRRGVRVLTWRERW